MHIFQSLPLFAVAILSFSPLTALAHETQHFSIGGKTYAFVVGSLNEPLIVDDKSGVDLTVSIPAANSASTPTPVTGLEQTLKVEIAAGGKKKIFDLTTQYGKPGSYKAMFFPTVQTTLTYRIFGTLEGNEINLSFSCNPAGHPATAEDTSAVDAGEGVTRVLKRGAFGCPTAKADLGFPEPAPTLMDLGKDGTDPLVIVAMTFGILGFVFGAQAIRRSR